MPKGVQTMNIYYVTENNSGGYTESLSCGIEEGSRKKPHIVRIFAENVDEAIEKFEKKFNTDWMYQNSYEGGSCNCCGRRYEIETPIDSEADRGIKNVTHYKEIPFRWKEEGYCGVKYVKVTIK